MTKSKLQEKLNGEESALAGRPATTPWKQDSDVKNWQPNLLRTVKTRPGFRMKWVAHDRVEKHEQMGWAVARKEHYSDVSDALPSDGSQLDSTIRRRELVLMEIPEEDAQRRAAHYEGMNARQEQDAKKRVKEAARKISQQIGHNVEITDES